MPVNFTIRVQLTNEVIKITPQKVDFGVIFEQSGSRIPLTLQNLSLLPQELYFNPLPKYHF
jgi:hypothetical protein